MRTAAECNELLDHVNSWDANLKFTIEHERDGILNYLDVSVVQRHRNGFNTSVFRKLTQCDRTIHPMSAMPRNVLVGAVNTG